MKRNFLAGLTAALFLVLVSGCGGDDNKKNDLKLQDQNIKMKSFSTESGKKKGAGLNVNNT